MSTDFPAAQQPPDFDPNEDYQGTVLSESEPEEKSPNTYNHRNILLAVVLGLVLVVVAFALTSTGSGGEGSQGRIAGVSDEIKGLPKQAIPPDRESVQARERGRVAADPFASGEVETTMTPDELNALLGAGGPAVQGQGTGTDPRSEYELQRRLTFEETLGLPSKKRINAVPERRSASSALENERGNGKGAASSSAPFYGPTNQLASEQTSTPLAAPLAPNGAQLSSSPQTTSSVRAAQRSEGPSLAVQGPFPPYTIPKGTLIPIVLESAVNSDIGGMIIARTTTDVYDRSKQNVLIPRGAEVISDYGSPSGYGQNRLDVAASRLNLPDGRYVDFTDAMAYDPSGRKGLSDRVDRHILQKFGSIAVLSLVGVATSVTAGNTRGSDEIIFEGPGGRDVVIPLDNAYRSPEDIAAQRILNEINRIISKQMDRTLDRPSTIKLRSGLRGVLILGDDIDMVRPYYEPSLEPNPLGHPSFEGRSPFDRRRDRRPTLSAAQTIGGSGSRGE